MQAVVPKGAVEESKKGENMSALYYRNVAKGVDMMLPFKNVKINGVIEGPIVTLDIDLTYQNPENNSPIECSYEFPLNKETIFAKLICRIEDNFVEAVVKTKEKAN